MFTKKNMVFLAQTDTTVGFLSHNEIKLNKIKKRDDNKPCIECLTSLHVRNMRIPEKYKNYARRAQKITFILKNGYSFRVVKDTAHKNFLNKFGGFMYSTSANKTDDSFDLLFCLKTANIIVEDDRGLVENQASKIIKLGRKRARKIR